MDPQRLRKAFLSQQVSLYLWRYWLGADFCHAICACRIHDFPRVNFKCVLLVPRNNCWAILAQYQEDINELPVSELPLGQMALQPILGNYELWKRAP